MYKVIIVDDEPLIVEGLSKVVDWKKFSCTVVATAQEAKEGADLIRTHKPDILFTDINMPQTSGLEMLQELRKEFPQLLVTIISGYSDFSLAQEAIRLGACRYLLKPTKMDEIHEAIGAMVEMLGEKNPEKKRETVEMKETKEEKEETYKKVEREEKREVRSSEEDCIEANHFVVKQALQFIREHYKEKLTLNQVAEQCYVSQWHLSKLLNGQLKRNFYDILNEIRVEKAKELLKDGSLRISDVSELVGYGEATHFSRIFKKETGMSANEYRGTLE